MSEKLISAASVKGERMQMTLGKAIELLCEEYGKALTLEYVRDPLAYALYHTWKKVDERKKK